MDCARGRRLVMTSKPHEHLLLSMRGLCFIGNWNDPPIVRLHFSSFCLPAASGKDKEMKTPKEFDYDLWIAEDGQYMVRVKATREMCAVSQEVFRKLRSEEKKLRREMETHETPAASGAGQPLQMKSVSLDYVSADEDDLTPAWLIDPADFEQDLFLRESIRELKSQLTERQLEVFEKCLIGEISLRDFADSKGIHFTSVDETVRAIRKKAKNFLGGTPTNAN